MSAYVCSVYTGVAFRNGHFDTAAHCGNAETTIGNCYYTRIYQIRLTLLFSCDRVIILFVFGKKIIKIPICVYKKTTNRHVSNNVACLHSWNVYRKKKISLIDVVKLKFYFFHIYTRITGLSSGVHILYYGGYDIMVVVTKKKTQNKQTN